MKKAVSVFLLICAMLALLAACGHQEPERLPIKTADAVQTVLDDLDITIEEANPHVHEGNFQGNQVYYVYVTVDGKNMVYAIDIYLGNILNIAESDHSH